MNEQNVVKFDEIASKLLRYLGLAFPIPANVGPESLQLKTSKKAEYDAVTGKTSGGEPLSEDENFLRPTADWLIRSGYIDAVNSSADSSYRELVLTEKGLGLLGIEPESLKFK